MTDADPSEITRLLQALGTGEAGAAERLAPLVYARLHDLAVRSLHREGAGHTLQPTVLVHEAFLTLAGQHSANWQSRSHFYSMAAHQMRRILVDHARKRLAAKRGGGLRVTLDEGLVSGDTVSDRTLEVIAIEEALTRLEALDGRAARVVELRFFAGLDVKETARALEVSTTTVKRDWTFARAFLRHHLSAGETGG